MQLFSLKIHPYHIFPYNHFHINLIHTHVLLNITDSWFLWNFHRVMTQTNRSSCQQVRIYYWRSQGHLIKWVQVLEEQCRTFQFNIALSLWHFSLLDHVTPTWHVMWWPHGRLSWAWPVAPYTGLPVYNTWTQRPSSSLPLGTRPPLNQSFPCINPPQGYSSSHILHTTSQNTHIYMLILQFSKLNDKWKD